MANIKFFRVAEVVERLEKMSNLERHDQVIRNIHALYENRLNSNPNGFVTSDDIKQSFSTFSGLNADSNFRDYFEDVFGDFRNTEKPKAASASFDRDDSFASDDRNLALEIKRDVSSEIKSDTLERVKEVVEASVSIPQYSYAGFTRLAKAGDSGVANWLVSFNTGTGKATIGVPVLVSDGMALYPKTFISKAGKHLSFDKSTLEKYAKEYIAEERPVAFSKSGLVRTTEQTLIPTAQMENENLVTETNHISLSYSIPLDENTENGLNAVESNIQESIEKARSVVKEKISRNSDGQPGSVNINVNIDYSGHLDLTEPKDYPTDEEPAEEVISTREIEGPATASEVVVQPFAGVIAFSIKQKTVNGIRTATVPVLVSPQQTTAEFFYGDGKPMPLNANSLNNFLSKDMTPATDDEYQSALSDAFSDSFLTTNATLNELRKIIKESIYGKKLAVANACMEAISSKFGSSASTRATADYINWMKEAKAYETKRASGAITLDDEIKRKNIEIDSDNDPFYQNSAEIHLM